MFRSLLLIAMICQMLGCRYACTATFASRGDAAKQVKCRCCEAKRLAEQSKQGERFPAEEDQNRSQTGCFCNSPVKNADAVQADQDLAVSPIWTIAETPSQLTVESVAIVSGQLRPPIEDAGKGLRLVVQSLLL
jgi:hypothetical protein